jgi:hypothetical protein
MRTRADFIYHMRPDWITIADSGKGNCLVADDLEAVLRKIEYGTRVRSQNSRSCAGTGKDFGIRFSGSAKQLFFPP